MLRLSDLILPYTRAELPGWGRLMAWGGILGAKFDKEWVGSESVVVRGKAHRYLMRLDRSDWSQRLTYFLGRYYEFGVLEALNAILRPGDTFVDIGANIGMISLHARSRVGADGQIVCFEPIPECANAIKENFALNKFSNGTVYNIALSDSSGELQLKITSNHTGTATLADVESSEVVRSIGVKVEIADTLIDFPVHVIKIDVEGFELRVLRGLKRTLEKHKPFIITELIEPQLRKAGSSIEEVSNFLRNAGYQPFGIASRRRGVRHKLLLLASNNQCSDVLWAQNDELLQRWISRT